MQQHNILLVRFMATVQVALIFKCTNFLSGILKIAKMAEVYYSTNTLLGECLHDDYAVNQSFISHGDPKLPNPGVPLRFNKW